MIATMIIVYYFFSPLEAQGILVDTRGLPDVRNRFCPITLSSGLELLGTMICLFNKMNKFVAQMSK